MLIGMCSALVAGALYGVSALRGMAGLPSHLSAQDGPFCLAVGYLAFRVLWAVNLRALRAEEAAADREMVRLTGDPEACVEGLSALAALLGTSDSWTLPQSLLFATHPAMGQRMQPLLRAAELSTTARSE